MIKIPPYLKKGDLIGITCPGSKMDQVAADYAANILNSWGFRVHMGITVGTNFHNFSAPDELRLEELQDMLDHKEMKAVLFGRGGYGTICIVDQLDWTQFRKHPKWLCGYSDITVLHAHIHQKLGIPTLHSVMGGGITEETHADKYVLSLQQALKGKTIKYNIEPHPMDRIGHATGVLVGGNLSILANLSGSKSQINTKGKILVLEDIGEYRYHIDRMMYNLKRAGWLDKLAGVVVGAFVQGKETTTPFGQTEYEIIQHILEDYEYPVTYGFPVGHQVENYTLKLGVRYELKVNGKQSSLKEITK